MNKKQAIILGVAGAALATAVIGGAALLNGRSNAEQASQGDNIDASSLVESSAQSEMEQYQEQIRLYDQEKQKLLESQVFYQGNATIQEIYKINTAEGDAPVDGSVTMVSEDILAYDERTNKCYLVARRISILGDDIKSVDIPRIYTGTLTLKVCGTLTEYYGNGVLQAYDVTDALEGRKGYYLDFTANPVRIGCETETIYTNPAVKNTYWVQLIGPTEVVMIATGVFTPEELPYVLTGLIPGLAELSDEKTYNASQTLVYDYTGGQVVPQGSFAFDYKKMTYDEVEDFLNELKTEAQKDKQLEDAAEALSDAWKDTLLAEQEIKTVIDASQCIQSYSKHFSGDSSADASVAKSQADILANGEDFNGELNRAQAALDTMEAEGGSLRKLEEFSLIGGDADQRQASDAIGSLLPVLKEYFSIYRAAITDLKKNTADLRLTLSGKVALEPDSQLILDNIRTGAAELTRLNTCFAQMSSDFYSVLLGYVQSEGRNETEFAALARLCGLWQTTLQEFLSGTAPVVDVENGIAIPADYPAHIVPLPEDAVVVLYETDSDGTIMLTLKTNMASEALAEYFESALSGARDLSSFSMSGMWTLTGIEDSFEVNILVNANQLGGSEKNMVQITLIPA
ncbi:MAG: hypothetical protein EOM59_11075 [Clostridia bacterium]|nr:hypothetical protein [Clostridia bacterium]